MAFLEEGGGKELPLKIECGDLSITRAGMAEKWGGKKKQQSAGVGKTG